MVSMATPIYKHLKTDDFYHIYEPAEDTFLLMDALEKDADVIKKLKPLICMEIGPGSGVLITFLAQLVGNEAFYIASDINSYAAVATKSTSEENKVHVECMIDSSVSCLSTRLHSFVDVMLFNPPYVVTPTDEIGSTGIEASWAGGLHGREVIDELLPVIASMMSSTGLFYLLLIKENKPDEIIKLMHEKYGFGHSIIMRRKSGPENQLIIRFSKAQIT